RNAAQTLADVRRILEDFGVEDPPVEQKAAALDQIREITARVVKPMPGMTAAEFCSQLPFSALRSFFQTKRLWGKVGLSKLFKPWGGEDPPLRSAVDSDLGAMHEVRNEV